LNKNYLCYLYSPPPKANAVPKKNLKSRVDQLSKSLEEHSETLKSLKDLPNKFDQLMEILSNQKNNGLDDHDDQDEEMHNEDDPINLLINKTQKGINDSFSFKC
jgi:hypothetical protein